MNAPGLSAATWASANQQALAAAVAGIGARIKAARDGTTPPEPAATPSGTALARIRATFALTTFERDILLLAAGPELDGSFPGSPSFGLALATLADPHWSALLPQSPLRWWQLITLAPDAPLCDARLRIEEAVLHALTGLDALDERLAHIVAAVRPVALPPSQDAVAGSLAAALARGVLPLITGPAAEVEAVAAAATASIGLRLYTASSAALCAPNAAASHGWLRIWQRDAALAPAALLLRLDADTGAAPGVTEAALRDIRTPTILTAERPPDLDLPTIRLSVRRPSRDEQAELWRATLRGDIDPAAREAAIDRVVTHFDLGGSAIAAAAHAADCLPGRIWAACRAHTARPTENTLQLACRARWADLALPEQQSAILHAIVAQVRHRRAVHDVWGFGERARNLGVTALFHGPSGTGKTFAAEVIAAELDIALHVVDLSRVVSKYIGDTERHLRAVFEAAECSGAALLFDEADALFGARSEVRDSHDRYANIEVSYLLQRMEQHHGLAILTTNMKDSIDSAFLRRIRFVVEFSHPGPLERRALWQRAFPPAAPVDGIDPALLAQANLTGAQIHNVALSAAFLAADAGEPIRMAHCLVAARHECAKLQRPLTRAEVAGWT